MSIFSKLLKQDTPADELRGVMDSLHAREREIEARIAAIRPGNILESTGPERRRLEIEGEPAELVDLDRELAELRAELGALPAKRQALQVKLDQAAGAEAAKALPSQLRALAATLKRYQAAKATADQARAELQAEVSAIGTARRAVEDTGGKAPGAPAALAAEIADALGHERPAVESHYSKARAELFQRLGSEQVEMQAAECAARARATRDGFAAERSDPVDLSRHPEASIWQRKAL